MIVYIYIQLNKQQQCLQSCKSQEIKYIPNAIDSYIYRSIAAHCDTSKPSVDIPGFAQKYDTLSH